MARKKKHSLAEFDKLFQEVGGLLFDAVNESMEGRRAWTRAVWDGRSPPKTRAFESKFCIEFPDGKVKRIFTPSRALSLVMDALRLRDKALADKWYGLKFTLSADGQCDITFDYDPQCYADPQFQALD
jgi:hypothetical protein